jgi:hypothetical protein
LDKPGRKRAKPAKGGAGSGGEKSGHSFTRSPLLVETPPPTRRRAEGRSPGIRQYRTFIFLVRHIIYTDRFFPSFWECPSAVFATLLLIRWTDRTMRSQIEPMKKVAQMLRAHRYLLLNGFWARGVISNAAVEGLNNKANLTARKAYGFRTYKWMEIALYHTLGALPEPQAAHKFC